MGTIGTDTSSARSLGGRWTSCLHGIRASTRRRKRVVRKMHTFSFGFARKTDVVECKLEERWRGLMQQWFQDAVGARKDTKSAACAGE